MDWMAQYGVTPEPPKKPVTQPNTSPGPATPAPGTGTENRQPDQNQPWGGFGTWGNWAQAFQAVHGKPPTSLDERDYWDSQLYAAQNGGVGPSNREWFNRYYTGNWSGANPWSVNRLPWRGNGPGGFEPGAPGTPNFIDWSPRGAWASPDYNQMAASQGLGAPWHFPVQDWAAWQQHLLSPAPTPTMATGGVGRGLAAPVAAPQLPYQLPLAGGLRQNTYAPPPPPVALAYPFESRWYQSAMQGPGRPDLVPQMR